MVEMFSLNTRCCRVQCVKTTCRLNPANAVFHQWPLAALILWMSRKCAFFSTQYSCNCHSFWNSRRMQTAINEAGSKRPSTFSVIRANVTSHGVRSMYQGLSASLLRQMTYSMVRIGAYEDFKRRLSKNGRPSTIQLLMAATVAGALGGVAGNPAGCALLFSVSHKTDECLQIYYLFE